MINPFTVQSKIAQIQKDVLAPLYTMSPAFQDGNHDWLLAETGRAIVNHQKFIEDICFSRLVAAVFKIVKILGGADQLSEEDFDRFTSYVNESGIAAMQKMLLAADKDRAFVDELKGLPSDVQKNAARMLAKANTLHTDFIEDYFKKNHGSIGQTPSRLRENFAASTSFISRLTLLAEDYA